MKEINYKKNAVSVVERLEDFYTNRPQDKICAMFYVPSKTLDEFCAKNPEGFCPYPDPRERIAFWDAYLKERMYLEDDSVSGVYLSEFDQGLYGGLVGGDAQFMCHDNGWISSMVAPILKDISEISGLRLDKKHPWFKRFVDQIDIFVEGSADKFGISHFILIDGINFVFELVGATEAYMDMVERPQLVKKAMDFAFDLNVMVQETFFSKVPRFRNGTFSNMVQWVPGKIVSESLDPFHMTSVDYFEDWGRENAEKMFAHFDGGVIHIHGNGRHLFEAASTLKGLKAIFLGDDKDIPLAFDVLPDIKKRTGDIPLVVTADYNAFAEKLGKGKLPGGVFYKVENAPDIDSVNRIMENVRDYRV